MHYYRIRNYIICLDDVCSVEPDFSNIIVHLKNGSSMTINFSDHNRRDEVVDELWRRLISMR